MLIREISTEAASGQQFHVETEEGSIHLNMELTAKQMEDFLLAAEDEILVQVILNILVQNKMVKSSIERFLNHKESKETIAFFSRLSYIAGRRAYEVPVQQIGDSLRPMMPAGNGTFFYTDDGSRVCVAATPELAELLEKQPSACYLGIIYYSRQGITQYGWSPE